MTQIQILMNFLEKIKSEGRLTTSDSRLLQNAIEEDPSELWENADYCALTGNFLLAFLDEEESPYLRVQLSHLAFLFYGQAVRVIEDKSNYEGIVDYFLHLSEKAPELMELYYQKIVLMNNFKSSFVESLDFLIKNETIYKFDKEVHSLNIDRAIDTIIHYYIECYIQAFNGFKKTGKPVPNSLSIINQVANILSAKNLTPDEKKLGRKFHLLLFHTIKQMVKEKNFDFEDLIIIEN